MGRLDIPPREPTTPASRPRRWRGAGPPRQLAPFGPDKEHSDHHAHGERVADGEQAAGQDGEPGEPNSAWKAVRPDVWA